ncbi:MAG: thiamine ABC transporter substrate-binding protein [Actinomycetota bacterium]
MNHRSRALAAAAFALVAGACASDGDDTTSDDTAVATDDTTTEVDATTEDDTASDDETGTGDAGDAPDGTDASASDSELADSITLVAYESFPTEGTGVNEQLANFTAETGIDVEILVAGDTGTMLSKAELTAGNPEGDVMWGIDNTFLSRAIAADVFEPYVSPALADIDPEFTRLVPNGEATPVDRGDVCVNYDIGALETAGIEPPSGFDDLVDPAYAGQLVVQNPATSSPGLAFLLATIDEYGTDEAGGWQSYWQQLVDNDVAVADGWTAAYYERFSYYGGDRPIVVSYGSSPPFEVLFADEQLDAAPTGVVESTCFRQVEFAGILAGTEKETEAAMLIDFLVSKDFQAELPLNVFVFPVNENVELDQAFVDYAVIPETSRSLEPAEIDANRSDWIDAWTDLVLG